LDCFPRQTYVTSYKLPKEETLVKKVEAPLYLKVKDKETILSVSNNKILLEFKKPKEKSDKDELYLKKKIVVRNCKMIDPKNEKNSNYEITMSEYRIIIGKFFIIVGRNRIHYIRIINPKHSNSLRNSLIQIRSYL
jgi:hypothetical protein